MRNGHVVASWKTDSLGTTMGFNLYRKIPATGKWRKVNRTLIAAKFGKPAGATYAVVDRSAPKGKRLTYRLKEICRGDVVQWYGPFRVTPARLAAAATPYPFR